MPMNEFDSDAMFCPLFAVYVVIPWYLDVPCPPRCLHVQRVFTRFTILQYSVLSVLFSPELTFRSNTSPG
jgi:hypothetical protein